MSTTKTSAQVPKLRFPGFEGEWEESTIAELIADKTILGHLDGNHGELYPRSEEFSDEGVPYISATDFIGGEVDFTRCKHLPQKRAAQFKKGVARDGDVLFAHNATVGPTAILRTQEPFVILSTTATYFRCEPTKLVNTFLRSSLEADYFVRQYSRVMSQSTRNQVPITTQREFTLAVPTLPEQQKIAAFLTAVDGRIEQLSRKKALLEATKKGVMQQLFTQTLRFQDDHGHDFPDWEEKTLGELCTKVGSGKTPKGGEQVYQTFGVKFIRSQNVAENRLDLSCITFVSEAVNTEMKGTEVKPLDVLLNITGASIGRSCVVPSSFDRGNVNQHVCIIRPQKTSLDPIFLQLFLSSHFGQKLIEQGQSGSGREGLNFQSIRSFGIPLPSLPEQTKIAGFLSALDGKIAAVGEQMRQTQAWKKGLLQQMFV